MSDRLETAWRMFPWPTLVVLDRRARLKDRFDYAADYEPGAQVYDHVSDRCYVCVAAVDPGDDEPKDNPFQWAPLGTYPVAATNDPVTQYQVGDRVVNAEDGIIYYCKVDGAFYGDINSEQSFYPLPAWDPAFPLDDGFQKPMAEVLGLASVRSPELNQYRLEFLLVDDAVRVEGDPGSAWFRYRMVCPVLEGDPWDAEATYEVGDQVYFTWPDNAGTGDFYDCIEFAGEAESPAVDPTKWRRIEIPSIFGNYLGWATHGDWLELDGQNDKALAANSKAFVHLQLEFDQIERQQRQQEPWTMATR